MMEKLEADHITFSYQKEQEAILQNVSIRFSRGKISLLTGQSGSGKSTLLKIMAGLYPKYKGKMTTGLVKIFGMPLPQITPFELRKHMAVLFQEPATQFTLPTPEKEIIFALENKQLPPEQMQQRIAASLAFVELTGLKNRPIYTLSDGEKQRAALAVILAMDTDCLLLDEPFANIDPENRKFLLQKLKQMNRESGKTIILVDHDPTGYANIVDEVALFQPKKTDIPMMKAAAYFSGLKTKRPFPAALPAPHETTVFSFHDLTISQGGRRLLQVPNFDIYKGKMTVLTGVNGCGKSTLFKSMLLLHKYEGAIFYHGTEIQKFQHKRSRYYQQVTMAFQNSSSQFLKMTIKEELACSLKMAQTNPYSSAEIAEILQRLHLADKKEANLYQLSTGQKKKVQILAMLLLEREVLLLDEPLAGLDQESAEQILELLQKAVADQGKTILMISHQTSFLRGYADHHIHYENQTLAYRGIL